MGQIRNAECLECKNAFEVYLGGGLQFHQLRCVNCDKTKDVPLDDIPELHLRFLQSGTVPPYWTTSKIEKLSRTWLKREPLNEIQYHNEIQEFAGHCGCGGQFIFDAAPRCPKCRSANLALGALIAMYD